MKIITFIVCDDIRSELGNKLSLMGLYNERIIFVKEELKIWPRSLRLGFFAEIENDKNAFPSSFSFSGEINGKSINIVDGAIQYNKESNSLRIHFVHPSISFSEPGLLRFKFTFFDNSKKEICSLFPEREIIVEEKTLDELRASGKII